IIWVMLETDNQLTMGATKEPTAIVSVECIGRLKPKLNLQFGTKLEEYLLQNLDIPKN
ncbi:MIF-like protein mif-2, partial [Biomphalaria pfeifferi]